MKVLITIEAELDDNQTLFNGEYELPVTISHAELVNYILLQEIIAPGKSIGTIHWEQKSPENWIH
tara:strand:+ start:172 stop:366 length:195 start_codon:yes stop_codon:yes gene_type:complete